ncbi:hypothetical protein SLS60_003609 [Paraconiothyrium brasiliense]|uniref:Major facilitator superfamily (MFS) profile domain-containing protein n=1 Tax=Paraconiothyrium brasiliense TaxID=300254 RepID=A0ABR3RPS5_9PLEO
MVIEDGARYPILVTGGCGFLGSHIVDALVAQHFMVVAASRNPTKYRNPGANYVVCDLTNAEAIVTLIDDVKPRAIIHTVTAGPMSPWSAQKKDLEATKNLISTAQDADTVKAFVYSSSAEAVANTSGSCKAPWAEEDAILHSLESAPTGYSKAKAISEKLVLQSNTSGLNRAETVSGKDFHGSLLTSVLRMPGIYGPRDGSITPGLLEGTNTLITRLQLGDNKPLHEWVYVESAAHAHVLATKALLDTARSDEKRVDGEAFFITDGEPVKFWDFARKLWSAAGDKHCARLDRPTVIPWWPVVALAHEGLTALPEEPHDERTTPKDWRFWTVFLSCCFLALLVSLDGTAVVIALPHIVSDLHVGDEFIWVANSFWLAGTIFQPLCAQLSNIYGRKTPVLTSIAIFFLGGAITGWARSAAALIAGRTVQGLGGGGILLLMEVIVCDILSVRERGRYLSIVLSTAAVGAIAGPPLGGVIADRNWRWIFWMNMPIAAGVFVVMAFLMRLRSNKAASDESASRVDWIGAMLFASSLTSLLIGLIFGGTMYAWSSWHVILPIVLGTVGWAAFHIYELRLCHNPSVPSHLFGNRTSVAGFAINFIHSMITTWIAFEWPTYFQGVLLASPMQAGVNYLAYEAFLIPAAGIAGSLVSKTGLFRPYQFVGFALLTLGCGLNVLLRSDTRTVIWVVLIAINAVGLGSVMPTMLPAILGSLPEKDVALATGMYSFLRSFGYIWGVTISAVIFNASFERYSGQISEITLRESLGQGKAYHYVSSEFMRTLPQELRTEVIDVYTKSLRVGWIAATVFAAVAMLLVFVEKHVPLRSKLDTDYGLEQRTKTGEEI